MATLQVVFFFFFFLLPWRAAASIQSCPTFSCSSAGPTIRFPFSLKDHQPSNCGYPYFLLSCNNRSQTIIRLDFIGDYTVRRIDYAAQEIWINDQDDCLPQRFLDFTVEFFTFNHEPDVLSYTFLNCSSESTTAGFKPISCLSGKNYSVIAVPTDELDGLISSCTGFATVLVPARWAAASSNLSGDIPMTWTDPDCKPCERRGGVCGFKSKTNRDIGCSVNHENEWRCGGTPPPWRGGLPRSAKIGLVLGLGLPGLLCIVGLTGFVCSRMDSNGQPHRTNTELPTSIVPQSAVVVTGLDGPTIESYPKIVLDESGRLPKPNDVTCPICLSEYQPKDTLRTIPECNHYFHANCIDEWLKKNASCPLCRNTPDGSSVITPCSSSSSSSSSSTLASSS